MVNVRIKAMRIAEAMATAPALGSLRKAIQSVEASAPKIRDERGGEISAVSGHFPSFASGLRLL